VQRARSAVRADGAGGCANEIPQGWPKM
jgi:hypothetical protein